MGRKSGAELPLGIENIPKFTVARLKEELDTLGLPLSGNKAALIDRLTEALRGIHY
jgi:hypothetical protein